MKTPHIALLALDIMDAMGIRYRVMGGPSACCGVLQFGAGDLATSGRVAYRTIDRLAAAAPRALSWCPTCQVQLTEIAAPDAAGSGAGHGRRSSASWPSGWTRCARC